MNSKLVDMEPLVECVANISEGQHTENIARIAESVNEIQGAHLLHVDSSSAANRSVITFAAPPEELQRAAFRLYRRALELIDMSVHKGVHPRIGAVDVCPFVPLRDISLQDCMKLANQFAEKVGSRFQIPVYIYGISSRFENRRQLCSIRRCQYEGLADQLSHEEWQPDFGPTTFSPKSGATVIGARPILIAYNVNLKSRDVTLAKEIAADIRESGVKGRPGRFPSCLAIGWLLEERGHVQVSTNLSEYTTTPPHMVYEEVKKLAAAKGAAVSGSEVVGLLPREALLMAGQFYSASKKLSESELIQRAIDRLGLNDMYAFDVEKKVLERCLDQAFGH